MGEPPIQKPEAWALTLLYPLFFFLLSFSFPLPFFPISLGFDMRNYEAIDIRDLREIDVQVK